MFSKAEIAIARIEDAINKIENLQREPDNWESENILYAIELLKSNMFDAAINRAELAIVDKSKRNLTTNTQNDKVKSCAELRIALEIQLKKII